MFGFCAKGFAENITELPSETGVVESIQYEDISSPQQGENAVKQTALVRITSGQFKGTKRFIDNMLTGNPAYDISLNRGDRVILHAEQKYDEIVTPEDVDYFIADIKRDNALLGISALFVALLLAIGRKKGVFSLISIVMTVSLIFFYPYANDIKRILSDSFCGFRRNTLDSNNNLSCRRIKFKKLLRYYRNSTKSDFCRRTFTYNYIASSIVRICG